MILIIAEKPALAKCIAAALPGRTERIDGAFRKGGYVITWSFGHLLRLKMPEEYDAALKEWTLEALPIYFPNWGKSVNDRDYGGSSGGGRETPADRLKTIGGYLKSAEMVIHAGDPDDEGQYLIDEILDYFSYRGPVKRLATGNTSEAALRKALDELDDNLDHVRDGQAAYARSVADLMVGVNLSRFFTLKDAPALITIGRVQTPTLGLVVRRDRQIEGHKKIVYYTVKALVDVGGIQIPARYVPMKDDPHLEDGRILDKNYAAGLVSMVVQMPQSEGLVTVEEEKEEPPLPFDLTELKLYCEKHWGYTPAETLDITQSLRERYNAISYNRSDCRYLSSHQHAEAPDVMDHVIKNISFRPRGMDLSLKSRAFDDAYVQGSGTVAHLAIIPQAVDLDLSKLTEPERNVYLAICKYYMAQFMPPAVKEKTRLVLPTPDGASLEAISTTIVSPGYRAIFKESAPVVSSDLSGIAPGPHRMTVPSACVKENETDPPPPYTQATLGKDMTRIARYVSDPKIKEILTRKDKGNRGENGSIGTEATRASIISGLIDHQYIEVDGKGKLHATALGRELCRILPDELVQPDLTALWWSIQEDMKGGRATADTLIQDVLEMIEQMIHTEHPKIDLSIIPEKYIRRKGAKEVLGTCPRCGKPVIEGKAGFGCSGWRDGCKFIIWKRSKRPMLRGTTFTAADAKHFLAGRPVLKKKLLKKDGGTFEAYLRMNDDPTSPYGASIEPDFSLSTKKAGAKSAGTRKRTTTGSKRSST